MFIEIRKNAGFQDTHRKKGKKYKKRNYSTMKSKKSSKVRSNVRKQALKYYLMGLNSKEIAKLTGKSYRTIQGYAMTDNWKSKTQNNNLHQKIADLHRSGKNAGEIANLLGVGRSTVYLWLKRAKNSPQE